ncbi:MAG: hypothetical protein KGJ88_06685 [Verrucomicrobiota bacterium]|nr:hypothetical protein [Verrucomicrobiota bacterium]
MPTLENNPNPENELQMDTDLENGDELNLPVNQREVLTRAGELEVRSLYTFSLSPPIQWVDVPDAPINNGILDTVTITNTAGTRFFRLISP